MQPLLDALDKVCLPSLILEKTRRRILVPYGAVNSGVFLGRHLGTPQTIRYLPALVKLATPAKTRLSVHPSSQQMKSIRVCNVYLSSFSAPRLLLGHS